MFGRKKSPAPKVEQADAKADAKFLQGLPLWLLFSSLSIVAILIALYMTVISTATPLITTYFGTIEDVDWYSTAYLLTICSLQPLTGHIFNLFRLKATFAGFLLIFAIGNMVCALAKSSETFIGGRAIAGIGAAGMFNGSMVIFSSAVSPTLRAQLLSVSYSMIGLGSVLGPVIGGAITEHLGWRWCLWIFLPPVGAVALVFLILRIPENTEKGPTLATARQLHRKLDGVGFTFFTGASIMLLFAFSWGGSRYAWSSATIIGLFIGAPLTIGLLGAWIYHRKDRALIPPSLLVKPVVFYGCLLSFFQGASFLQVAYYLPIWFQSAKGASPQKGGIMLLPFCISQIVGSILCGILVKKIPYAPVWAIVGNSCTAIGSGLLTSLSASSSSGHWIGYQVIGGLGRGIAMQMPVIAIQEILSPKEIPIATAVILFFQYFAGAVINCLAKTIFVNQLGPALHQYAPNVDAQAVIHSGATEILQTANPAEKAGLVEAYNKALTLTFWLPAVAAIMALPFCYGLGWHKVGIRRAEAAKKAQGVALEKVGDIGSERKAGVDTVATVSPHGESRSHEV